jgi:4-hydroxybenzoate polyprenyltransferase
LRSFEIFSRQLVKKFLGLIRFSHTIFALPFAALASVWALSVASKEETTVLQIALRLVGILICMVAARSAAMSFNRLVDAKFDALNPRTSTRHIPAGQLSRVQVLWFFIGCCTLFLFGTLLFLPNIMPAVLSLPVLAWLCGYSFAKRFTSGAHLWLGFALALSPICAWVALRGETLIAQPQDIIPAILLGGAIALWVSGFDIIYACQDADFDRGAKLHSVPAKFGVAGALKIAALLHLGMWLVLLVLPSLAPQLKLAWLYYLACGVVAVLLARQHLIVNAKDLSRVNEAFFTLNAIISFGFTSIAAADTLLG